MTDCFLITCEHGGNRIPSRYCHLFLGREALLSSHYGYDPGALAMARGLAWAMVAPLYFSTISRLLIDLNRSTSHPALYSEVTRNASVETRRAIMQRYYLPYRQQGEAAIAELVAHGHRVIHISSHSFTPELNGEVRNADIGLLYDPSRCGEVELCCRWQAALASCAPEFRVRRNYPYTGKSDGFTSYLRRRFAAEAYIGIELEINQKHVFAHGRHWRDLRKSVPIGFGQAMTNFNRVG
jgi:predicted N-formylglutamate amidohydrolase